MTTRPTPTDADASDLLYLRRSFVRHLAADGRSAATRAAYTAAIAQLEAFLVERGLPTVLVELQPHHLEAFFVRLHERGLRPTTILARHHALARFFGWLVDEHELGASPMSSIRAPVAALPEPRVLTAAEIEALLAACAGSAFEDVRDAAMLRLLVDTGLRLTEMAGLQLDDVDLEHDAVSLAGRGRVPRAVPFDRPTARALQGYLAARAGHAAARLPAVWLGRRGRLTGRGVEQAVRHRGRLAGVPELRPHHFRHTFVQRYLAYGGAGADLRRLVGWRSRQSAARAARLPGGPATAGRAQADRGGPRGCHQRAERGFGRAQPARAAACGWARCWWWLTRLG